MQNGPADQADLADFIARGNKPDLVALLRHAGERLPSGSDTTADHRVVLLQYLRRAPGHLILALESQIVHVHMGKHIYGVDIKTR